MAETIIAEAHRAQLLRMQHLLEYFQAERARIEAEMQYVMRQGQAAHGELVGFLAREYGVNTPLVSLDAERGVFVTADKVEGPAPTVAQVLAEEEVAEEEVAEAP